MLNLTRLIRRDSFGKGEAAHPQEFGPKVKSRANPPCPRSGWGGGPRETRWRGLLNPNGPSTMLRTVPLPMELRSTGRTRDDPAPGDQPMKPYLLVLLAAALAAPASAKPRTETPDQRVERVLTQTPVIDGHNDLPWEIRDGYD